MIRTIDRDELKDKFDRGDRFILVETLPEYAYRQVHLPGAINLPPDRVQSDASRVLRNKNTEIVVYCASAT